MICSGERCFLRFELIEIFLALQGLNDSHAGSGIREQVKRADGDVKNGSL
jgi:hypothetical protein